MTMRQVDQVGGCVSSVVALNSESTACKPIKKKIHVTNIKLSDKRHRNEEEIFTSLNSR